MADGESLVPSLSDLVDPGDHAESVFSGIKAALDLSWRPGASCGCQWMSEMKRVLQCTLSRKSREGRVAKGNLEEEVTKGNAELERRRGSKGKRQQGESRRGIGKGSRIGKGKLGMGNGEVERQRQRLRGSKRGS